MILGKIDVTKIDKAKLFEGKNGAKYLDVCLIDTPNDKYGNSHMIVQSVSKEEREAGVKGAILGNAKTIGQPAPRSGGSYKNLPDRQKYNTSDDSLDEDVPF
jgi:hypothetical protein